MDDGIADKESEIREIRRLVELVTENGLSELTVEQNGTTITVRAALSGAPASPTLLPTQSAPQHIVTAAVSSNSAADGFVPQRSLTALESPMVGVFYRSGSPEDPPFIQVGDVVRVGDVIGLIEAMKVYSEIPAEASGRVTAAVVENGALVQQGQPLYYLEPI